MRTASLIPLSVCKGKLFLLMSTKAFDALRAAAAGRLGLLACDVACSCSISDLTARIFPSCISITDSPFSGVALYGIDLVPLSMNRAFRSYGGGGSPKPKYVGGWGAVLVASSD